MSCRTIAGPIRTQSCLDHPKPASFIFMRFRATTVPVSLLTYLMHVQSKEQGKRDEERQDEEEKFNERRTSTAMSDRRGVTSNGNGRGWLELSRFCQFTMKCVIDSTTHIAIPLDHCGSKSISFPSVSFALEKSNNVSIPDIAYQRDASARCRPTHILTVNVLPQSPFC